MAYLNFSDDQLASLTAQELFPRNPVAQDLYDAVLEVGWSPCDPVKDSILDGAVPGLIYREDVQRFVLQHYKAIEELAEDVLLYLEEVQAVGNFEAPLTRTLYLYAQAAVSWTAICLRSYCEEA